MEKLNRERSFRGCLDLYEEGANYIPTLPNSPQLVIVMSGPAFFGEASFSSYLLSCPYFQMILLQDISCANHELPGFLSWIDEERLLASVFTQLL